MKYVTSLCLLGLILIVVLAWPRPAAAIVSGHQPDPDDRRFDAVGAFGITRRLSAEVREDYPEWTDTWYGGATLIAPQLIVTAQHVVHDGGALKYDVPGNYAVRFRRQPDGTLQERSTLDPDTGERIYPYCVKVNEWILSPVGDIIIGVLDHPVTHIDPIPVSFAPVTVDEPIILAGWGSENTNAGKATPRSRLMLGDTTVRGTRNDMVTWPFWLGRRGAWANMHDSGGAILRFNDLNELEYIGSISTYSGGQAVLPYDGTEFGQWLTVPEPATLLLLAGSAMAAIRSHRKRRPGR